mgnify:CR=1 FL=1
MERLQLLLSVDEDFKKLLKIKAIEHNKTMKALVVEAVKEWIEKNEKSPK